MDCIKDLPNGHHAIMAITTSKSTNVLGFYWNPDGTIESKWINRNDQLQFVNTSEVSLIQRAAVSLQAKEDSEGRLEVSFGLQVSKDRKLYLISTPDQPTKYAITFFQEDTSNLSQLKEIYVDFDDPSTTTCYCRCMDLTTNTEFPEKVDVDLGPLRYLV